MRKWWIVWPLYAGLMGFVLGASFFFGLYGRNVTEGSIASQHEQRAANEPTKSKKEESDEALAFYTLWLMGFTGVLAFATIGLGIATAFLYVTGEKQFRVAMRASIKQSRDMQDSIAAANAAHELNKRSFESVHRPKIRIKHVWFASKFEAGNELVFRVAFVNSGTGAATLRECGIRTYVVNNIDGLPPSPQFLAILSIFPAMLPSGITMDMPSMSDGKILTSEEMKEVREQSAIFVCTGYVEYQDASGVRKTSFCRKLEIGDNGEPGRFVATNDPDYEYED
jgi:hypothetical protein